jgi:hypothetical protein
MKFQKANSKLQKTNKFQYLILEISNLGFELINLKPGI